MRFSRFTGPDGTRRLLCRAAAALLLMVPTASGQDAPKTEPPEAPPPPPVQRDSILDVIPADALFVVTARHLAGIDEKVATLLRQMDMPFPFTPSDSLYAAFGLMEGIDTTGDAAFVGTAPADTAGSEPIFGLILPTTDFTALIQPLQPKEADGGLFSIQFKGKPAFAREVRGYAVMSESKSFIQGLLKSTIRQRWSTHQLQRYAENDVGFYIDVAAIAANPTIQKDLSPGLWSREKMAALSSLGQVQYSLRLDERGLFVQALARTTLTDAKVAGGALSFDGLPAERYALALAASINGELVTQFMGWLTALIESEAPSEVFPVLKIILDTSRTMSADAENVRVSINGLPQGADGLVCATKLVATRGPASAWIERFAEGVAKLKTALTGLNDEQAAKAAEMFAFRKDAETVDGVSVHHVHVNLEGAPDVDYPKLQAVIGREGLLIRVAAVSDRLAIIHVGGGPARFEQVLAAAKNGSAALGSDAGIQKTVKLLPDRPFASAFLSLDGLLPIAFNIGEAMGDPPPPVKLAPIGAPIAMAIVDLGGGAYEATAVYPVELIIAVKNAVMETIARSMGGPPQPTP